MAAWRKSFPCAANASVANNSYSNGSSRQRSSTLLNDEDDNTDSMSFISGRGNPESRRNRHRRSFSNASQSATDVEGTGREDRSHWGGDDTGDAKGLGSGNNSLRRRGSKRAVLKKVLKGIAFLAIAKRLAFVLIFFRCTNAKALNCVRLTLLFSVLLCRCDCTHYP